MKRKVLVSDRNLIDQSSQGSSTLGLSMDDQVEATIQAAARSAHSVRSYYTGIGRFLQYLEQAIGRKQKLASMDVQNGSTKWTFGGTVEVLRLIEPSHLSGFRSWLDEQGLSRNTVSQRYAAARTFLSVACRDGILSPDQAARMGIRPYQARVRRDTKPTGRRLSKEEVRDLRAAIELDTKKGLRDRALIDMALYAGLRCSELASLRMSNFRQDKGDWWIVLQGKGAKTRRVKMHDVLYESLTAWLQATGRSLRTGSGPVFYGFKKGDVVGETMLGSSTVSRLVAEYGAKAGLAPEHGEGCLGPHDLRRTCARNAYENGAPLPMIQSMLGHADVATTMRYIGTEDPDKGGAIDFVEY